MRWYFWRAWPRSDARRVTLTFSRCQCWGSGDVEGTTSLWKHISNTTWYLHRNQCRSIIIQAGSKDGSSSMVALYINSRIVCGFLLSLICVPTPKICSDIWYHVESYAISMFLARRLKITFTSNPKLTIIFFVITPLVLLSTLQVVNTCCLD